MSDNQALVLTAPTGSGKTTRIPPAILAAGLASSGQIVVLQPRRLAARAVAHRMAENYGQAVGQTVGYRIRFESVCGPQTKILVLTEGILTRWFVEDPLLEGVGCIILDEFHERSIHADLALSFTRELLAAREEMKLVVMSATMQLKPLQQYLGGCPALSCPAPSYDVKVSYLKNKPQSPLPELIHRSLLQQRSQTVQTPGIGDFSLGSSPAASPDHQSPGGDNREVIPGGENRGATPGGEDAGSSPRGDTLVFLPGAPEIRRATRYLEEHPLPGRPLILPLHGSLGSQQQDRILRPSPQERIVLCTNIAETSLTVPGVRAVVDSGLAKRPVFEPRIGMDRLELIHISRNSAQQRAGRAGREAPGEVLRLWTEEEHKGRPEDDPAEIQRLDLAPVLLSILSFQPGDPACFPLLEPPAADRILSAQALLKLLGAITPEGTHLTPLGKRLATLPVHPRVGVILDRAARRGQLRAGSLLAALLSERDLIWPTPPVDPPAVNSDLVYRMELFEELESGGFTSHLARRLGLNFGVAQQVRKVRDQLLRLGERFLDPGSHRRGPLSSADADQLLLAGYPDRVCRRRGEQSKDALSVGGRGVKLSPASGVFEPELFIALVADAGRRGLHATSQVHLASGIQRQDLERVFPRLMQIKHQAIFDPHQQRIRGIKRTCFLDLVLEERETELPVEANAGALLWEAAQPRFEELFHPNPAAIQLMGRIQLAAHWHPHQDWPPTARTNLERVMKECCEDRRSFQDLRAIKWERELEQRLTYQQRDILQRDFPLRLEVPSGRTIKIDYSLEGTKGVPVVAVKLQELFGLAETPSIASGKLPIMLHLLSPGGRPVQMTQDLKSFWDNTYGEVRKDLRGRYPKHPWPENPWAAEATHKTQKRLDQERRGFKGGTKKKNR